MSELGLIHHIKCMNILLTVGIQSKKGNKYCLKETEAATHSVADPGGGRGGHGPPP